VSVIDCLKIRFCHIHQIDMAATYSFQFQIGEIALQELRSFFNLNLLLRLYETRINKR
jgi:hypothetical protein